MVVGRCRALPAVSWWLGIYSTGPCRGHGAIETYAAAACLFAIAVGRTRRGTHRRVRLHACACRCARVHGWMALGRRRTTVVVALLRHGKRSIDSGRDRKAIETPCSTAHRASDMACRVPRMTHRRARLGVCACRCASAYVWMWRGTMVALPWHGVRSMDSGRGCETIDMHRAAAHRFVDMVCRMHRMTRRCAWLRVCASRCARVYVWTCCGVARRNRPEMRVVRGLIRPWTRVVAFVTFDHGKWNRGTWCVLFGIEGHVGEVTWLAERWLVGRGCKEHPGGRRGMPTPNHTMPPTSRTYAHAHAQ